MTATEQEVRYNQLCVWPATLLGDTSPSEFEQFMFDEMGARVKYEGEYQTLAGEGGEGGRNDLLFYVADEDVMKFAIPRLSLGISWWEDHVDNHRGIIPENLLEQYPKTW